MDEAQLGVPDGTLDVEHRSHSFGLPCYFGGRQHTLEQLGELAGSNGFEIASIVQAARLSVVELRASH
ncbi:hypothetical protein [Streptomyces sp. NPDC058295]|uniref:hypothetical protein n=1 Tax=Streptomyces sp. NPDC058295 TaxID=3346431 RepID=UPI0036E0C064